MTRKISIAVLSLATIGLAILTIGRMQLDYNENGVYFDGGVTYNTDAIVVYSTITGTLLLITVLLMIVWKKRSGTTR